MPEETFVSIDDRGYMFGDGVYETMRCYRGRVWALERHLRRLERSLAEVEIGPVSLQQVREWIGEAVSRSGLVDSIVYVQVTRGVAPRQHVFGTDLQPTVLLTVRPTHGITPEARASGVLAITVEDRRWARRDIKSINLLPNVLAKQAAHRVGAFEAILVEPDGRVTEGSSTNLFIVQNGTVWTAPADHHILGGITRDLVIDLARENGIQVQEEAFSLETLWSADEIFLSGTTTEVLAITRLDDRPVGSSVVGPVTRRLFDLFEGCVRGERDALKMCPT